jgi:hypothetical protein
VYRSMVRSCRRQIVGKLEETCTIDLRTRHRYGGQLLDPALKVGHALQRVVPARVQLAGYDVARMIVAQQDIPFVSGLREAAGLRARPSTIRVRCALLPKA